MCRASIAAALLLTITGSTAIAKDRLRPIFDGTYECRGECKNQNGTASIVESGSSVTCTRGDGSVARGSFTSERSVMCWGLNGLISEDNKVIDWGNGSRWVKK